MRKVSLTRFESGNQGTFGRLFTDISNFTCLTGELPWRENQSGISSIPTGIYQVTWLYSPAHQRFCYHVMDVPNRTAVEIHAGNFSGDVDKGFDSDVKGCILPGLTLGTLKNRKGAIQKAVLDSKTALFRLELELLRLTFELTIIDA